MQIIQNVHVDGFEITPNIISVGTRGSFGISKINFVLSSEWENNACKVVFHPLFGAPIEVIYTGEPIDVPFEIMKNGGIFEYVVSGVVRDESGVSKQISLPGKIKVLFTLDDEGRESAGFKPSALAQVLAIIGNIKELDQYDANNIIEALEFIKKNSSGGEITETDPTVPEWAKEKEKPTYTASEVGADPAGTASSKISEHNVDGAAHNDLRILLVELKTKVENFLDVDDVTADELSEVIELIRDNADLIEGITKSKVNVSDIINNLTTNVSNKPLSAAQGVAIKDLIDELEKSIAAAESLAKKAVRTVNGKAPDENGNVEIEEGGGGIANETDPTIYVGSGDAPEGTKVQIDPEGETMEILTPDDVNEVLEEAKASGMFDGAPGSDGEDGVGIASAVLNSDYSLTLTFTDGTSYTTPSIRGANGEDGTNGLGFSGAYLDENGQLILVYEDDNGEIAVGTVVGENGTNGTNGKSVHYASSSSKQSPDGYYEFAISALIAQRDDLIIADDSYVYQIHSFDTNEIALCNRLFSIKGADGKNGSNGTNGADGTSVTVSKVTESTASGGTSVVTFSDGSTLNVKNGKDGKDYSFDPTVYGLPVLYLTGDTTGMTKETAVTLNYECNDKDGNKKTGSCTLKWQGSSSLAYEKKNYTIKFGTALEIVEGWGAQTKYCLKANFIDHSHARNLVCAKLWGQVVKSRATTNAKLNALPNAGAVDGFPIVIMLNGEFHGLYTWNIPKDAWMFGMGSGAKEAFVCADVPNNEGAVAFKKLADLQNDFELEYSSDDKSDWVLASLNTLIQAVLDSNGKDLDTTLAKYIDWESAIDYYIFTVLICGLDNTKKNYILATYDGTKWFYSAYDMDSTFGVDWDGGSFQPADRRPTFATRVSDNLMALIWNYKRKALHDRAKEIMESVFSESNVSIEFSNFASAIPKPILLKDVEKWTSIPSTLVNNTAQILNYYRMRFANAVKWLEDAMNGYAGDTESEATNLVPISTDASGAIYNGTGYKNGYRLSSSGSEKAQDHSTLTGYMPFTKSDILRLTGVRFATTGTEGTDGVMGGNGISNNLFSYLAIYDANKTLLNSISCDNIPTSGVSASGWSYPIAKDTDIMTFGFSGYTGGDMAYIRINAIGDGADMIVTINEEI